MAEPRPYGLAYQLGNTFWFYPPPEEPISVSWDDITGKPTQFPVDYHQHAAEDISGLDEWFQSDFENVKALQVSKTRAGFIWVNVTRDDGLQEGAMFRRAGSGIHDGVNTIIKDDGVIYTRCQ